MSKSIRRMMESILLVMLCAGIMTGCGKKEEPVAELPEEAEEYYDDEGFEEYEDYEDIEEESEPEEDAMDSGTMSSDEIVELAKNTAVLRLLNLIR